MENQRHRNSARSPLVRILILALVYFASGRLGLHLAFGSKYATAVWPPTGLALASLLVWGLEVWPGVLIGAFFVNLTTGHLTLAGLLASAGVGAGNTLEAVAGAYLVNRFADGVRAFERVRNAFAFVGLAAFLSTAISATIGVTVLSFAHLAPWKGYVSIWFTWWVGDTVSNLIVAPLVLLWAVDHKLRWSRARLFEAALAALVLAATSLSAFTHIVPPSGFSFDMALLAIVPLCWVAFRFRPRETATAIFFMSAVAIWGALHGLLSSIYSQPRVLLDVQQYVGTSAILFLVVATEVFVRKRHEAAQKEAVVALRQSEERERKRAAELEAIMQAAPMPIWVSHDPGCLLITGNPAAERLLGLPPGANVSFSAPEAERPKHLQIWAGGRPLAPEEMPLQRAARGETIRDFEMEFRFADGSARQMVGNATPLLDGNGHIRGAIIASFDVTQHKLLQFQLRENEELLRFALAAAGMHAWEWDLASGRLVRSHNALPLWGVEDESGADLVKLIDPEDFKRMKQQAIDSIGARAALEIDHRIVRSDGQRPWVASRGQVRYSPDGRPISIVGISTDITRRKQAERQIAAQLAIARTLTASIDLAEAAPAVLQTVCEMMGWEAGSLWTPDPEGNPLRSVRIWHDPGVSLDNFAKAASDITFALGNGLPGRVWASRKPCWIPDLTQDARFSPASVASLKGLRAAFVVPILHGERCLGVLAFYSRHIDPPDESLLSVFDVMATRIGLFIERCRANDALRENEARLSLAMATARTFAWDWDLVTGRASYSANAVEILGFHHKWITDTWEAIHPEDLPAMKRAYAAAVDTGKWKETDLRIQRPDGQIRWISIRADLRCDFDGRPLKLSGVAADITGRKRSEDQLRLTLDSVPSAIIVVDPQGKIAYVNSQTEECFGYAREEMLEQPVEMLVPERLREQQTGSLRSLFAAPGVRPMGTGRELYGLRKDGSAFPIEVGVCPFQTESGTWVNAAIADISERRRIEREKADLRNREQAFDAQRQLVEIVSCAPEFIKMTDADHRVLYMNPAGRKMIGLTEDQDVSRFRMEDLHPAWACQIIQNVALPEAERCGFWSGELAIRSVDGREIPVSHTMVAHRDSQGVLLGYSSIGRDISDQKKAERSIRELAGKLIHAQEEERGRIGRELHDHVAQMLALVAMQLDLESRSDLAELAKQAADDVRQLSHRLHSSTLQDFGLVTALDGLVKEFRERRGVEVDFEFASFPQDLPQEINLCLLRIVEECLNNIARHSGAKSSLVELTLDNSGIHLSIQDDGRGFDPAAVQEAGGLGLVSIRERLRVVHGEMRIQSKPLQGSRIEVSIPAESLLRAPG